MTAPNRVPIMRPQDVGLSTSTLVLGKHSGRHALRERVTELGCVQVQLRTFEVRSVIVGEDAQGEALLTVEHNGRSYRGAGISTNILESAARAYLEVINRIEVTTASANRNSNGRGAPLRPTLGPGV